MLLAAVVLTALAGVIALNNWRMGMLVVIPFGLLQDPFRKLTPGLPAYYILWAVAIFGIVAFAAYSRGAAARFSHLYLYDKDLRGAWSFFIGVVALQAVHALVRWQNPLLPVLGLLFYLGPVAALLVAIGYSRSIAAINRFMLVYIAIMFPAVLTVYLSSSYGESWPVLKEIGELAGGKEMIIYDVGTALKSYSGVFRVGEIAAWHAATCASFMIVLVSQYKSTMKRLFVGGLVVLLVGAIVLTGRRKMLMTLSIFVIVQLGLILLFHRRSAKPAFTLILFGIVGSLGLSLLDPASEASLYMERGASVFGDAGERMRTSISLFFSALSRGSGIGLGAGVTSQGAQYAGGAVADVGGVGEAGLGKLVVELGVPGAAAALFLALSLMRRVHRCLGILARMSDRLFYYAASFSAMLVANIATFFVATQVYGDLFILLMLGVIAGFMFTMLDAGLKLAAEQRRRRMRMSRTSSEAFEDHSDAFYRGRSGS